MRDFNTLLSAVSRSFYLTIRLLPSGLRRPVGLAYLLARASDTVADSACASAAVRLAALNQMEKRLAEVLQKAELRELHVLTSNAASAAEPVANQASGAFSCSPAGEPDFQAFIAGVADPSEKELLGRMRELWEQLEATPLEDLREIAWVMKEILQGQRLDLERFEGGEVLEKSPVLKKIRALADAQELDDYTYRVAGCVGAFWTRICLLHLPRYAPGVEREQLCQWGVAFGKGLQLVNILRDAPADLANGRCYLPADALSALGKCSGAPDFLEILSTQPALVRPVFEVWVGRARERLGDGLRYIAAIRPWRVRLACFLPWALGLRTLRLLEQRPPLEVAERIKVPRKEVRRLLVLGAFAAWKPWIFGNRLLMALARRVSNPDKFPAGGRRRG